MPHDNDPVVQHFERWLNGRRFAVASAPASTADDLAAHRADEFLAMAMLDHELRKRGGQAIQRGMCASCGQVCAPAAVYCDADCREDHELQLAAQARAGRAA